MRKRPTVRLFKSFQLLLGAFLFLTAGVHAASEERMTLATIRSVTQAPFWVALESGFYKDYGLEVLPVQFTGGTQTIMALVSGDVQMTTTGGPAAVHAKLKGANVLAIGTTVGVFPYIFYVSGKIRKPEDLKGRRIGISSFGGASHAATRYALQRLGLNPEVDVTLMQIGNQAGRLSAMTSGGIDGTLIQPPETLIAREMGLKPMLNLAQSGLKFPMNQMTTTGEYLKSQREKVKRFMMGSIAGVARLKADRDFTMKVLKKFMQISDQKLLAETYDFWVNIYPPKAYVDPEEIENYLVTVKERGSSKPADFIDNSIVAELDREGFIEAVYKKYGR